MATNISLLLLWFGGLMEPLAHRRVAPVGNAVAQRSFDVCCASCVLVRFTALARHSSALAQLGSTSTALQSRTEQPPCSLTAGHLANRKDLIGPHWSKHWNPLFLAKCLLMDFTLSVQLGPFKDIKLRNRNVPCLYKWTRNFTRIKKKFRFTLSLSYNVSFLAFSNPFFFSLVFFMWT